MRTKMIMSFAAIAMLFALAIPVVVVRAGNSRIYFTGSELCDPDTFIFARI